MKHKKRKPKITDYDYPHNFEWILKNIKMSPAQRQYLIDNPWLVRSGGREQPMSKTKEVRNHTCEDCWRPAPFGYPEDKWYCRDHRPW